MYNLILFFFFFFQAEDGIRDIGVTGVQTCALPISLNRSSARSRSICAGTPPGLMLPAPPIPPTPTTSPAPTFAPPPPPHPPVHPPSPPTPARDRKQTPPNPSHPNNPLAAIPSN